MPLVLKLLFTEIITIVLVALFGLITVQYSNDTSRNIVYGIIITLFIIVAITLLLGTWGFI